MDKRATPYIVVIALVLGLLIGIFSVNIFNSLNTNRSYLSENNSYLGYIKSILNQKYLGELPKSNEEDYALVKGYIDSLDDPYTSFLTPEETEKYKSSQNPNFEGIGVSLKFNGENTVIESVFNDYPGERAGLRNGDIVKSVDGEDMLGKTATEVASNIRGDAGTVVKVEIYRPTEDNEVLSFDITREKIDIDNVSFEELSDGIYKINIFQFIDETPQSFNESWDKIVDQIVAKNNFKGIILDLRSNPGGYVYSLRYVLDEFLTKGTVLMKERQKDQLETVYKDQREGAFEDTNLVVLVNEGSASASEILASGIQDNNRGEIVGKETVGKGVEQELVELEDGSLLIVVFQEWLTPNGRRITPEDPITPDHIVEYTEEDYNNNIDPQLDKALELAK